MCRSFVYLLFCALSFNVLMAQTPSKTRDESGADTSSTYQVNAKNINSIKKTNAKTTDDESYKKYVSAKNIVKELNSIIGHLEIINKPEKPEKYIAENSITPYAIATEKSNVVLRLRIVNEDAAFGAPLDCKLIIDSLGYSNVYLKKIKDSVKYINARLRANNKEVLIKLRSFKADKENISNSKIARENIQTNDQFFYKKLPYLLAIIAGVIIFLWAINKLTGNTLFLKKTTDKSNFSDVQNNITETIVLSDATTNEIAQASVLAATYAPKPLQAKYFSSEIMMTAGPRKRYISEANADKDLGEDVCGFISNSNNVFLWLMDGTSDQFCLKNPINNRDYFSSRLLAQSIAGKMRNAFSNNYDGNINELITDIFKKVKQDWLNEINRLPEEEKNTIGVNIANRNIPECATTLLFAHLSIDGNLTAFRSGDSSMFLYNKSQEGKNVFSSASLEGKNIESNDRLFFRMITDADGKLDILYNAPKFEMLHEQNVQSLIAFSDGVGMETESFLKQHNFSNEMRDEIIIQVQGTADDKSICFIEIKE